ncbi:Hypothetical predicted protein, partial [Mytilus galloprovincialis]
TNDVLPNDASLCEPWDSACDVDDMCDPNPCQNNGTCVDLTDSFNCTCAPGWEDDNCTTGINDVLPNDVSLCEPWDSACDMGTSDVLPDDVVLCEPWDSACDVATTIMTPTAKTQKQSIPPMSTAIGTATSVKWIEKTQNAMKPSTSIEIDSTTDVITTGTTQKTSFYTSIFLCVKNTVSEILNHYTGLIIAGGLIISGLLVVIAIYCLIKKRQKDPSKYTSTNVTNKEEEKVSHIYSEPSEVYHEYSEPSEVYHEYSEPSEVYHEYSEPARVFHVYRGRQHGYEETIFQE